MKEDKTKISLEIETEVLKEFDRQCKNSIIKLSRPQLFTMYVMKNQK